MVQEWFEGHNKEFEVLTWPQNSKDLIPIEELWDVLDKTIRSLEDPPCNLEILKDLLIKSWCSWWNLVCVLSIVVISALVDVCSCLKLFVWVQTQN